MKLFILILAIFLSSFTVKGQCNCDKIFREDGTKITMCEAFPVASDNKVGVGLAAASNGQDMFVTLAVRFASSAINITDDLTFRLVDNNLFTLTYIDSKLVVIGGSEVAEGIFLADDYDVSMLRNSNIKTISFNLSDGLERAFIATLNSDVLKKEFDCLSE